LTEARLAPGVLEHTLGRLVEAGIAQPDDLAALLGLESQHIARPLRNLTLVGAAERQSNGGLQLTPAGRVWLKVAPVGEVAEPLLIADRSTAPRLRPLRLDLDEAGSAAEAEKEVERPARVALGRVTVPWSMPQIAWPQIAWPRVGVAWPRLKVAWPRVQVVLGGVEMSASAGRRIAAGAAAAVVLMLAAQVGLPTVTPAAEQTAATAPVPIAEPAPAVSIVAEPPPERWVTVQRTEGVGLVLRPSPGSTARVLTLQEGARVRVTGDPVQQAGRVWLPVTSQSGKTGWVAGEFVAPLP
jgi:hypothetical protein